MKESASAPWRRTHTEYLPVLTAAADGNILQSAKTPRPFAGAHFPSWVTSQVPGSRFIPNKIGPSRKPYSLTEAGKRNRLRTHVILQQQQLSLQTTAVPEHTTNRLRHRLRHPPLSIVQTAVVELPALQRHAKLVQRLQQREDLCLMSENAIASWKRFFKNFPSIATRTFLPQFPQGHPFAVRVNLSCCLRASASD
jgi:hypothetical protein